MEITKELTMTTIPTAPIMPLTPSVIPALRRNLFLYFSCGVSTEYASSSSRWGNVSVLLCF